MENLWSMELRTSKQGGILAKEYMDIKCQENLTKVDSETTEYKNAMCCVSF